MYLSFSLKKGNMSEMKVIQRKKREREADGEGQEEREEREREREMIMVGTALISGMNLTLI